MTAIALSITFVFVSRIDMAQKAVMEYRSEVFRPVLIYPPTFPQVPVIVSSRMKLISTAS